MCHALIIDDNMVISHAIEDRLAHLGFHSFDHTWTEAQALAAAELRTPDLVVVGESIAAGSALNAARKITFIHDVPVLMVTTDPRQMRQDLPRSASCDGPFPLAEIETAVGVARNREQV